MTTSTRLRRLQRQDNIIDNVDDIERRLRRLERASVAPPELAIMGDDGQEYWLRIMVIRDEPRLVIIRKAE